MSAQKNDISHTRDIKKRTHTQYAQAKWDYYNRQGRRIKRGFSNKRGSITIVLQYSSRTRHGFVRMRGAYIFVLKHMKSLYIY